MTNRRVLIAGQFGPGALEASYARAFETLGYEPFCFDSLRVYQEAGRAGRNRVLRRLFRPFFWGRLNRHFEELALCVKPAFIIATKCCFLEPETVRRVRRQLGVPVFNIYPDHPYCGAPLYARNGASTQRRNLIEVFREYSAVFMWEKRLCERLRADGVQAVFLPFGVDPEMFHPYTGSASSCPECGLSDHTVVFAGHYSPKRDKHVSAVARNSVALWGRGWTRMGKAALRPHRLHRASTSGLALAGLYTRAAVSLNVVGELNVPGHNMRTFEIPASGGVMLAYYTREQDDFFPEDEAAAYYRVPEELDDKIERLLRDAALRERIRRNAIRIAAQHSYRQRAETILGECGIRN